MKDVRVESVAVEHVGQQPSVLWLLEAHLALSSFNKATQFNQLIILEGHFGPFCYL